MGLCRGPAYPTGSGGIKKIDVAFDYAYRFRADYDIV